MSTSVDNDSPVIDTAIKKVHKEKKYLGHSNRSGGVEDLVLYGKILGS